jgi:hypothetical protein
MSSTLLACDCPTAQGISIQEYSYYTNNRLNTIILKVRPVGCDMLRIPHCLDNRLTEGGEVVSLMCRLHPAPQKHFHILFYFFFLPVSGTHF